jgi:hypothetical protein
MKKMKAFLKPWVFDQNIISLNFICTKSLGELDLSKHAGVDLQTRQR